MAGKHRGAGNITSRHCWHALMWAGALLCGAWAWAEQRSPLQRVQRLYLRIVHPQEGETLRGVVGVRVRARPENDFPLYMHASLAEGPWLPIQPTKGGREWVADLDSRLAPNGPATLRVRAGTGIDGARSKDVAVEVVLDNPLNCYFGDIHSHTSYSDGSLFPADAYSYARDVAKLDFFCLTDHHNLVDAAEWADTLYRACKANQDGVFVALAGLEWTTDCGHANIFEPKSLHWPDDVEGLYSALNGQALCAMINHPGDGTVAFNGLAYSEEGDSAVRLIELRDPAVNYEGWNPHEEAAYLRALRLGWHVAPAGSDDTHWPNWGNAGTWTAILAPGLSKANVLWALRNRRCYSTSDRNCWVLFWVNDSAMGDIVRDSVTQVRVVVDVRDPDAGDTIAKIELFEDGMVIHTDRPESARRRWEVALCPPPGQHYYFAKVTQADGNKIWGAPVWVRVSAQ